MRSYLIAIFLVISISNSFSQFKEIDLPSERIEFKGHFSRIAEVKPITAFPLSQDFRPINFLPESNSNLQVRSFIPSTQSSWIQGTSRSAIPLRNSSWEVKCASYLEEAHLKLWENTEPLEFTIKSHKQDFKGVSHIKIQQKLFGLPIFDSECYLHGKEDITSLNGRVLSYPSHAVTKEAMISKKEALTIARPAGIPILPEWDKSIQVSLYTEDKTELGYLFKDREYKLVYKVTGHNNLVDKFEKTIDASTGEIIKSISTICKLHNHELPFKGEFSGPFTANAKDLFGNEGIINTFNEGNFFFLIDATRSMFNATLSSMPNDPVGVIWTIDAFNTSPENADFKIGHISSTDNNWEGKENGVSAHINAGKAYEYFKNVHGRESINGEGGNIISLINISDKTGSSLENAFWNGTAMFYGSGGQAFLPLARGLDVAAHELAHGVIQNTANLNYEGESGAINESMADIFGAMVDRNDWLIGEDVVKAGVFPSGALRNLQDPHNGAMTNDYGRGFQPKHVSEKYTGTQDQGGVHINSGIPNHAYYLFATAIGKDKAEKIFYRALSTYLLRSSQFIDLRLAVIQSAKDLDENGDQVEEQAAANAFDLVGIVDAAGGDYLQDLEPNIGNEYLLAASADRSELYLYNSSYQPLFLLFDQGIISKPSVSDDGSSAVFVGQDNRIYIVQFNWESGLPTLNRINESPIWRNAVLSKDNRRIAALYNDESNRIFVYDFELGSGVDFELYNPTFTEGVVTNNVDFADAIEFDVSGNYIMYDARSTFPSDNSESISIWEIGFLKIWNEDANTWSLGNIQKLFTTIPEGTNIGNPSFSKNSPYIITFDRKNASDEYYLMGANLETGELRNIAINSFWNVPNYNVKDEEIIFELFSNNTYDLISLNVDDSKISYVDQSLREVLKNRRWGVWFANGQRSLNTSTSDLARLEVFSLYPNPSTDRLTVQLDYKDNRLGNLEVFNIEGQRIYNEEIHLIPGLNKISLDVSHFIPGTYIFTIRTSKELGSQLFIKP